MTKPNLAPAWAVLWSSSALWCVNPAIADESKSPVDVAVHDALVVSSADFEALCAQVLALTQRLDRVERLNGELVARNEQLERAVASAQVRASQAPPVPAAIQTNAYLAQNNAAPAAAPKADTAAPAPLPDWVKRFSWTGDFRYRHEETRQVGIDDRDRERIQAHFGFTTVISPQLDIGVQLATGGDDPRAANQTLTGEGTRKPIGLDLAYFGWNFGHGLKLTGGKMKYPFYRPSLTKLYDGDVNPEGLAFNYNRAGIFEDTDFFSTAYTFWLEERASAAETNLYGVQVGAKHKFSKSSALTAALMYSDFSAAQGRKPFYNNTSNGNSLNADGTLASDFQLIEAALEYGTAFGKLPFTVFADVTRNQEALSDRDTAYATGFLVGKASAPGSWEGGYSFERVEKDGFWGGFVDSDFGAGLTDTSGHILRVGYAPAQRWVVNATYYSNDLAISNPVSRSDSEFRRLQLDFNVKY